jgi:hypothetical protein
MALTTLGTSIRAFSRWFPSPGALEVFPKIFSLFMRLNAVLLLLLLILLRLVRSIFAGLETYSDYYLVNTGFIIRPRRAALFIIDSNFSYLA